GTFVLRIGRVEFVAALPVERRKIIIKRHGMPLADAVVEHGCREAFVVPVSVEAARALTTVGAGGLRIAEPVETGIDGVDVLLPAEVVVGVEGDVEAIE